jgi:hypothetical protein
MRKLYTLQLVLPKQVIWRFGGFFIGLPNSNKTSIAFTLRLPTSKAIGKYKDLGVKAL